MSSLNLLSREEAELFIRQYWHQAADYSFGVSSDGKPSFMLKDNGAIAMDSDGSVTWTVREISVGLHSFIELETGEKTKKRVYLSLCLVNPVSRQHLELLLNATISPTDGRFNSKPAEVYILTLDGRGFEVKVSLPNMAMQYVMLKIMPSDFALKFKSQYCPFCRKLQVENEKLRGGWV